jgi:pimeloyl-ACP methyl ester carboxylesterase
VIWGGNDVLLPPALGQAIAAGIRSSHFVLLPHAGHVLMVDAPGEFNREVLAFLAKPDAGESS